MQIWARGVWSFDLDDMKPTVCQYPIPANTQNKLYTAENPRGSIMIIDLRLAGMVLKFIVLECIIPRLCYKHFGLFCDNTSTVSWALKIRASKSIPAAKLLRLLGLRLHP